MLKKIISICYIFLFNVFCFAIKVYTPSVTSSEVSNSTSEISSNSAFWMDFLKLINKYLWESMVIVMMGVLIYGGYLLMTSEGNEAELKKANNIIKYSVLGICVVISSYIIVKLVTNLF